MVRNEWIEAAKVARKNAYAPYSQFAVGAALVDEAGRIHRGCNVENISFGLTLCAERVALGAAIACGVRHFQALVVLADTETPVSPCGACRQSLAEFAPDLPVILATVSGTLLTTTLTDLFPRPKAGILERRDVPRGTWVPNHE